MDEGDVCTLRYSSLLLWLFETEFVSVSDDLHVVMTLALLLASCRH
jgi:hypothetical protein